MKLIHGNCYEELKKLPDNSVDFILTDPPYELDNHIIIFKGDSKQGILYNPVTNTLTIDSEIPLTKVEIYSILGKKVKEIKSDFNSIPTNNLSNGVYFVRMHSENGLATKKLIKK